MSKIIKKLISDIDRNNNINLKIVSSFDRFLISMNQKYTKRNLFGLYYFEILKIFSHSVLMYDEVKSNKLLDKEYEVTKYPYIGPLDIKKKNIIKKHYKKNFSNSLSLILKILIVFSNFFKKKEYLILDKIHIDKKTLFELIFFTNYKIHIIELKHSKIFIKNLNDQIECINRFLINLIKDDLSFLNYLNLDQIVEKHIRGNCSDNKENIFKKKDIKGKIILGQMNEFRSRVIAFTHQNSKIYTILHGEGFGILDEPLFGKTLSKYLADYVIGYNNFFLNFKNDFKYTINEIDAYLNTSSDKIYKNFQKYHMGCSKKNIDFCYIPTSFSSYYARYGPYRDISDKEYSDWHIYLNQLFENNLIFKYHPKEKLYFENNKFKKIDEKIDIFDLNKSIDVFVFDYISTAFYYACSTNKPVILFDLGIRNINSVMKKKLEERVILFDLHKNNINLNINSIKDLLIYKKKINNFPMLFSINDNHIQRSKLIKNYILQNEK